jgi:hypothetical protein
MPRDVISIIGSYSENPQSEISTLHEQYARYRTHIETMMQQKPYDFTLLLDTFKHASPADFVAALNHDMTRASAMRDLLTQFRNDLTPRKDAIKRAWKLEFDNIDFLFLLIAMLLILVRGSIFGYWAAGSTLGMAGLVPGHCGFLDALKSFVRQKLQSCKTYAVVSKRKDVSLYKRELFPNTKTRKNPPQQII